MEVAKAVLVSAGTLAAVDVYVWLTYFQLSSPKPEGDEEAINGDGGGESYHYSPPEEPLVVAAGCLQCLPIVGKTEALPWAHKQESSASFHGRGSKRTPPPHARSRHRPAPASTHAQSCTPVPPHTGKRRHLCGVRGCNR